jgi:hypothetical protein
MSDENFIRLTLLTRIKNLHSETREVAEWNKEGEALCDACMLSYPCPTVEILDSENWS